MTLCGEVRLDARPASAGLVSAMLAASVVPVVVDRCQVHLAGPIALASSIGLGFAVPRVTGPGPASPLVAAVNGWAPPDPGEPHGRGRPAAARLAADFDRAGPGCLDDQLGDWVAAVWDPHAGRMVLARAPLGMHRILLYAEPDRILFATEMGQLRAAGVPMRVNEAVLAEMLARGATTIHETLVRGVQRLPAGELVEVRVGARTIARRPFSSMSSIVPPLRGPALHEAASAVRAALVAAVDAAVPDDGVGVELSGGVDSSTVLGLVRGLPPRGGRPVRAVPISMVFPGCDHDESPWIDAVEEHLGVRALRVTPEPYDWDRWRAWTARAVELPVRPNAAMTGTLLRVARAEGLSVMLTGEGGDDWFRGRRHHFPDLVRAGHCATLWRQSGVDRTPRALRRRVGQVWYYGLRPLFGGAAPGRPTVPWVRAERTAGLGLDERWAAAISGDAIRFGSADHRGRWNPSISRASGPLFDAFRLAVMATGVDWRHPLHDQRVVRRVLETAGSTLYSPTVTKRVLRAAAGKVLPPPIQVRRDKARFDLEIVEAVEAAGGAALLRDGPLISDGWIDFGVAERAWARTVAAARSRRPPAGASDDVIPLWDLFGLHTWLVSAGIAS
jgi:asparagine synthase (glutamine-hydrolysing)